MNWTSRRIAVSSRICATAPFVNGAWVEAKDGRRFEVTDPSNGRTIVSVPRMSATATREAIAAAKTALPSWSYSTAGERAKVLKRWAALMRSARRRSRRF